MMCHHFMDIGRNLLNVEETKRLHFILRYFSFPFDSFLIYGFAEASLASGYMLCSMIGTGNDGASHQVVALLVLHC